ncbi:MAG: triose-phosphate isomerase [Anaerovoracaceae bacterium]
MRKPFIAANWKMNMLIEDAVKYGEDLVEYLKQAGVDLKSIDVAVCVPYIHMAALKVIFVLRNIMVGAQNMHFEEKGAFTGEISPAMLKDMGIECVIIGHSERRQYFGETSEVCAKKVKAAVAHKIRPILCVGETLQERESGNYENAVGDMLSASLAGVTAEEMAGTVIAYEPLWAIGTGITATAQQANEMASFIRQCIAIKYGQEIADQVIIQYGGSVKPENIAELMSMSDIDGALVGGASLDAKTFTSIVNYGA